MVGEFDQPQISNDIFVGKDGGGVLYVCLMLLNVLHVIIIIIIIIKCILCNCMYTRKDS